MCLRFKYRLNYLSCSHLSCVYILLLLLFCCCCSRCCCCYCCCCCCCYCRVLGLHAPLVKLFRDSLWRSSAAAAAAATAAGAATAAAAGRIAARQTLSTPLGCIGRYFVCCDLFLPFFQTLNPKPQTLNSKPLLPLLPYQSAICCLSSSNRSSSSSSNSSRRSLSQVFAAATMSTSGSSSNSSSSSCSSLGGSNGSSNSSNSNSSSSSDSAAAVTINPQLKRTAAHDAALLIVKGAACVVFKIPVARTTRRIKFSVNPKP